ncbi:hypothetical protein NUH86_03530 [Sphingobium sp. JS3065]|nr:hypothetical protein [Sphingobium sp. JS3065]UZW55879.1 hypothetical protein NUH86_03530 [Sphingobium sp. JS3065]
MEYLVRYGQRFRMPNVPLAKANVRDRPPVSEILRGDVVDAIGING